MEIKTAVAIPSFKVTVVKEITFETIGYLLDTAFEGGSNYWYFIKGRTVPPAITFQTDPRHLCWYTDYPLNVGGDLIITVKDGEDFCDFKGKEYHLNLKTIEDGLRIMQEKYPRHFNDVLDDNYDAETGDVFLQCCLFNDAIFG